MARHHGLALALWMGASFGCGGESRPTPPAPAVPSPPAAPEEPWRFRPTLEQHLPQGAVAEPLVELSLPRRGTVIVLAAVLRQGATAVKIERWTFEQIPGEEGLGLVEGGETLLRLQPGQRHPQLGDLRRSLAQPRAVLTRPLGLGDEPRATLEKLAAALAILRDPSGDANARVKAAGTVMRGLDDAVVFERDAIWQIDTLLDPAPTEVEVQSKSDRRARAKFTSAQGSTSVELLRKSDGWAVSSFKAPPPPEPEPAATGGSTGATGGSPDDTVEL